MQKKSEIGSLLNKGMGSEEIKERIRDFPENPDIEYFKNLGYTEATAKNYMFKLKKNNSKQNENSKTTKKEGKKSEEFITSANPDYQNIILDTCAVGFEKTSEIIDNSAKATVIYAVINEFDRILKDENKPEILKNGIKKYRNLMLKDNSKYRLVPYKYRDKRYTDDIIIEYLMDLPVNERPTLLTVDKNLALKAKCLGLEFILYFKQSHNRKDVVEKQDESTNLSITAKEENENFGVKFIFRENDIQIKKHNPKAQIFWVNDGKCLEILDRNVVEKADFFVVLVKVPKWRYVKIQKVMMVNNQVVRRGYKCAYINDIYKLENEFSQEILDRAKLLLF